MPFSPGNAFFEYRITRPLGQGAFGTVYLAQDTLLDRPVAIKELSPAAQADPVAFQRFLQEARAAGSLNHPNIVTVYALKPTDAAVYLVMEYLPGGSLRSLLSQRGRLPVEDAARIAADVCDGLAAAHAKGIVHRDVKPENILLTADGRAKVGDFGIAHVPRAAGGATVGGLTEAGFQPGTLVYMSPEQIRGEAVDGRSDVYQVGAMLHEMLAGRHYLDIEALTRRAQETTGGNVLRMQARLCDLLEEAICKQESPDVRRLRPDIPDWLGATAAAMLARQAAARPTAERVAEDLRNGKSHPAEQDTASHRSVLGAMAGLFGKSRAKQPAPAGKSQPVATQPVNVAAAPSVSGLEMFHEDRKAIASPEGRPDEAIRKNPVCGATGPEEAKGHFDLGVIHGRQGRTDEAIREFQAALRIDPAFADGHYNLGLAFEEQGCIDEAMRAYQATVRVNPDYFEANYNLGGIYVRQGRTDEAIRAYQAALRINPAFVEAHLNLGVAYGQQGRIDEEIREYQAALGINPDDATVHLNLGATYGNHGRTNEAICEYQAALRINPAYAEAHLNLGLVYEQQGRTDEAIRAYQAALRINPAYAEVYYSLGVAYGQQGRTDEEIQAYQAALRINPAFVEAYVNLAAAYLEQDRTDEAVQELQKALRANPNDAKVNYNLGIAYMQQGRTNEAIRSYQAALRIDPTDAETHFKLGLAHEQQGRADKAIREYQAAQRINPNSAEVCFCLGLVCAQQGRIGEAVREYQAALRVNPNWAEVRYGLGIVYAQQGRLVEAREEVQRALQLGYAPARQLLDKLR